MADLFVKSILTDVVLLEPRNLGSNYIDIILSTLNETIAGRCSKHGFVEPNSITIHKITQSEVVASSLNGSVQFTVQYHANVCNPPKGAVISARAVNRNKFGIQAHSGILYDDGTFLTVIQSIVTTNTITKPSEVDLTTIDVGDEFYIEVLTKQFQLGSPRIIVIGRIVKDAIPSTERDSAALPMAAFTQPTAAAAAAANSDVEDEEDDNNSINDSEYESGGDEEEDADSNEELIDEDAEKSNDGEDGQDDIADDDEVADDFDGANNDEDDYR